MVVRFGSKFKSTNLNVPEIPSLSQGEQSGSASIKVACLYDGLVEVWGGSGTGSSAGGVR